MFKNIQKKIIVLSIGIIFLIGCQTEDTNGPDTIVPEGYIYTQPVNRGDGWETDSITNQSIDLQKLTSLMAEINKGHYNDVNSILIVKGGALVFEEYFTGTDDKDIEVEYDWNVLHHNASVTKSITSGLIGIAYDQRYFESVDSYIFPYFSEYTDIDWSNNKDLITIKNLLTMTAGLYYDESSTAIGSTNNSHYHMLHSPDPVKWGLEQEMVNDPGLKWNYSSANIVLLGRIIKKCTGIYIDKFAENTLFNDLGITDYHWNDWESGDIRSHGGLALRPRDMAKFGQLYLNGGVWKGKQVISKSWVSESINNQIPLSEGGDYGYTWWLYKFQIGTSLIDSYAAVGWGGQYIFVLPSLDAIVVFTNGNFFQQDFSFDMLRNYLLPALL